jgi:hypothetical protein
MEATLKETLDAALSSIDKKLDGYLRNEAGDRIGVFRWLPATEEEAKPIGGARIDAIAIEQMAASLNERSTAIPIDGGPTPTEVVDGIASEVHGTAKTGGGTPANGWAHAAVVHVGDDGVTELYLYAELFPSIAREVDAGRLAFGSVHFGFNEKDGDAPRDVTLISHALTNDPAVTTLSPANDVRTPAVAFISHRTRSLMAKPVPAPKKITIRSQIAFRGPALDKLTEVAASLGIDIDEEMDAECWSSPTSEAIQAIKSLAKAEKVLEGLPSAKPKEPVAASADAGATDAAKSAKAKQSGQRAEGDPVPPPGDAKPADGAEASAALDLMRELLGKPEATLAECIDLLKANADPIKKAIGAGPDAAAQADANQAAQASAEPKGDDAARSARMDDVALRSEVATLRTRLASIEGEASALRATALRTRVDGEIRTALTRGKREMGDDLIATLVADLCAVTDDAARARHLARAVPGGAPIGDVMGKGGAKGSSDASLTQKSATDSEMEAAKASAAPNEPKHVTRARAQRLASAKHPHLFEASGGAADSPL